MRSTGRSRRRPADASLTGTSIPTGEYLTRHALESFLFRLTRTEHSESFVLKGGILLDAYGVRRPTRDIDAATIQASLTPDHITLVVHDIAAVQADDGVTFGLDSITVHEIRENAEYADLRLRVGVRIGTGKVVVAWDVFTGDPIIPPPRTVQLPRLLGEDIDITGYRPETLLAERGVTILERGTTSTRWRDYVDIVQLPRRHAIDAGDLRRAAESVARYRNIELRPITAVVTGYGEIAQPKWAAWRRKERLEDISEENLDAQMARVAAVLGPAFAVADRGRRRR